jgi:hypothetical protein
MVHKLEKLDYVSSALLLIFVCFRKMDGSKSIVEAVLMILTAPLTPRATLVYLITKKNLTKQINVSKTMKVNNDLDYHDNHIQCCIYVRTLFVLFVCSQFITYKAKANIYIHFSL